MSSYRPYQHIERRKSRQVMVGRVPVGGGAPITVQTMTNTLTTDVAATVAQIKRAEAAGVDATMIPKALKGGRADSALLQEYMPRFAARDYRRTGRIDNMVKDLNGAADLARLTHTPMPLTALCAEVHRMLTAAGLGGEDQAALMEYFKGPERERFA